jgi:hypothetical protein
VERLTADGDAAFAAHRVFPLQDLLALPAAPKEEADIEGLAVDEGWLWLVGSHSVKRKKAKASDAAETVATKLAELSRDGNRHLLARIPIRDGALAREDGSRRAAALAATRHSSALLDAIVPEDEDGHDPHLAAFVPLPGKDNGLDIEGLAVRGSRAFIGLRGPVLREWCCILEVRLDADGDRLSLRPQDGGARYRKHFLKLNGLGIRDLIIAGDDLLILAGPSMAHDGPHEIWRWKGAAGSPSGAPAAKRLLVLPYREGVDRAEGFTRLDDESLLVVFDTPADERLAGTSGVRADVFRLT